MGKCFSPLNLRTVCILLAGLVLLFSCQLKKEQIQDEFLFLEAVIQSAKEQTTQKTENKESSTQKEENKEKIKKAEEELLYSLISPPLLLHGNTVYIRDREKFFWLNTVSGMSYALFSKQVEEEKQKENLDFLTIWIRKKNLNFQKKEFYPSVRFSDDLHTILDFIPGSSGDFYIASLMEKEGKNYKSILHFDPEGEKLAQIGNFDPKQYFVDMNLDDEGFLNVVVASYHEKGQKGDKRYELFRYSEEGLVDFHESDLMDKVPKEEGFWIFLEDLNFFPGSQTLVFLTSYYSKKEPFLEPQYKKLLKWNPKQEEVPVEIVTIKRKNLSLLGLSQGGSMYLIEPLSNRSDLLSQYGIEVWNQGGRQTEKKVLVLDRSIQEALGFFSGEAGEILVFKKQKTKANTRRFQAFFY